MVARIKWGCNILAQNVSGQRARRISLLGLVLKRFGLTFLFKFKFLCRHCRFHQTEPESICVLSMGTIDDTTSTIGHLVTPNGSTFSVSYLKCETNVIYQQKALLCVSVYVFTRTANPHAFRRHRSLDVQASSLLRRTFACENFPSGSRHPASPAISLSMLIISFLWTLK